MGAFKPISQSSKAFAQSILVSLCLLAGTPAKAQYYFEGEVQAEKQFTPKPFVLDERVKVQADMQKYYIKHEANEFCFTASGNFFWDDGRFWQGVKAYLNYYQGIKKGPNSYQLFPFSVNEHSLTSEVIRSGAQSGCVAHLMNNTFGPQELSSVQKTAKDSGMTVITSQLMTRYEQATYEDQLMSIKPSAESFFEKMVKHMDISNQRDITVIASGPNPTHQQIAFNNARKGARILVVDTITEGTRPGVGLLKQIRLNKPQAVLLLGNESSMTNLASTLRESRSVYPIYLGLQFTPATVAKNSLVASSRIPMVGGSVLTDIFDNQNPIVYEYQKAMRYTDKKMELSLDSFEGFLAIKSAIESFEASNEKTRESFVSSLQTYKRQELIKAFDIRLINYENNKK